MASLRAIGGTFLYGTVCVVSICLVIAQLYVLMQAIRYRRGKGFLISASLNLLLGIFLFITMMDCSMSFIYSPEDALRFQPFQLALFDVPWIAYGSTELICAAVFVWHIWDFQRFRDSNLTPDAIRQTLDLLPTGICIGSENGTVLLSNLKMNEICRELTGHILSDSDRFISRIESDSESQNGCHYLKMSGGSVYRFELDPMLNSGKRYNCLTAVDVTERYRVTEELKAKNKHLQEVKQRMQAVSELTGDMFVAQEEASARAALHNQLGQVLLMGRHYLEHPDTTDAELVCITTTQMNSFLLGEYTERNSEKDDMLSQVMRMVKTIGVTVEVRGDLPDTANRRTILAHAIQECAANTVKHASGDRLTVDITEYDDQMRITVTNNGMPPKTVVAESGGLLSLRRSIEEAGGVMTVQSQPVFVLTVTLPNR